MERGMQKKLIIRACVNRDRAGGELSMATGYIVLHNRTVYRTADRTVYRTVNRCSGWTARLGQTGIGRTFHFTCVCERRSRAAAWRMRGGVRFYGF